MIQAKTLLLAHSFESWPQQKVPHHAYPADHQATIGDLEILEEAFLSDLLDAIGAGIKQVTADHSVNVQKNRYKSVRDIGFQACIEYFERGTFDELVTRASANAGNLPEG